MQVMDMKSAAVRDIEVEIPKDVFVQCPMKGFKLRGAVLCIGCEHFCGLVDKIDGPAVGFESRYGVGCKHPINRRLVKMEMADS